MDITNVIEIAEQMIFEDEFTVSESMAEEIINHAEDLKEEGDRDIDVDDIQEAIIEFKEQCDHDKAIMRERALTEGNIKNFDLEEWDKG